MLSKREIMDSRMPMVSSSMGVVNSLLGKLTKLEDYYSDFKDLTRGLESIRKDLLKFAARGVKSMQVKQWMKQVREMLYDMEDWIDLIIHQAGGFQQDKTEPATDFVWSELAEKIEEFKAQIHDAQDRCTRYGLLNKALASDANLADLGPSKVTIDPNLLWGEKTGFVALEGPENELVNRLTDEEQRLKVVSILGMGGLGKTTLAKQVYGKLKRRFQCRAFVYGGQNPSMKTTLINILYQVMSLPRYKVESWAEKDVISKLWEFLGKNRYFIVIDDIWSIWAWSAISCTLPDNNLGSRILTTTRIDDVAKSCCVHPTDFVHPMKALSECDSKSLLLSRISVPEEDWPFDSKICDSMLKLCGGNPLAIIVTAGLLAAKCAELGQQKMLEKPIFEALDQYSTSEGIQKILDISFADLSLPVKSCLLYLSAFPEDYIIKKDHLIRIWVAEKFIPKRGEESLWETGESYFNELIGRRLIQPVFLDNGYEYDQAVGCTVHTVILDFIVSLSSQENFLTPAAEFRSMSFPLDVIRRLSLNNSNHEDDTLTSSTVDLRKVRSLSCFGDAIGMPDLLKFTFLRVLDLNNTMNLKSHHLENIGRLFLLRYLGLRGSGVTVLPEDIGQLQHMEILDLRRNSLGELPASIVGLRKLVCLLLGYCERLPRGVENMPDLEELTIQVDRPVLLHDVAEIVKSKRLRMLGVRWSGYSDSYDRRSVVSFLNVVGESSLQSLLLEGYPAGDLLDLLLDSWVPPHHLRRFELTISGILRGVPPKMASLVSLTHVTHLGIKIGRVEAEDLRVLGDLPNLDLLRVGRMARQEEYETAQESYEIRNKAQEKNLEQESGISDKDSDEEHVIMEVNVYSNMSKQTDSRVSMLLPESPSHLVNPVTITEMKQSDTLSSSWAAVASSKKDGSDDPSPIRETAGIASSSKRGAAEEHGSRDKSCRFMLDTGASFHMTGDPELLSGLRDFPGSGPSLAMPDGTTLTVAAVGSINTPSFVLPDVSYVPGLEPTITILSAAQLIKSSLDVVFSHQSVRIVESNGTVVGSGRLDKFGCIIDYLRVPLAESVPPSMSV